MMIRIAFFVFLILSPYTNFLTAQGRSRETRPKAFNAREIAAKVLPSVVLIITQDENGNPIAQGSGFVYRPGLVVSNLHVFERATNATVKNVKTGEISKVIEVVGMNASEDICVIRIDNPRFQPIALGNSTSVETGDEIYVLSNPKGLEGSFSKGIISSFRTSAGLFQLDAAISPGSSGGVLLNTKGQAIGIIKSSLVSGQNLNFAIPINELVTLPLKFNHSLQLAGACAYTDREMERLKGGVKTLRTKDLPVEMSGKPIGNEPITTELSVFDTDGKITEKSIFQPTDGQLAIKFVYTYDENRLATRIVTYFGNGKADEATFDLAGRIRYKLALRKFSGSIGTVNGQGGMQVFDSDGNMTLWYLSGVKNTTEFDALGRAKTQTQWRDGVSEIVTRYGYKEDEEGNWIERIEFKRYPNTENMDPNRWIEGTTEYREITYYN